MCWADVCACVIRFMRGLADLSGTHAQHRAKMQCPLLRQRSTGEQNAGPPAAPAAELVSKIAELLGFASNIRMNVADCGCGSGAMVSTSLGELTGE